MSHTPGPWEIYFHENGVILSIDQAISSEAVLDMALETEYDTGRIRAFLNVARDDANLIVAAPDLLSACEEARDFLSKVPGIPNYEGLGTQILLNLMKAIAKAEGKT